MADAPSSAADGPAPGASYEELVERLAVAEQTLYAIHHGEVDALMISTAAGPRVYTLQGADEFYRAFVEQMVEGAIAVLPDGTVLFANQTLAELLGVPLESVLGSDLRSFVTADGRDRLQRLLDGGTGADGTVELNLRAAGDRPVPVRIYAQEVTTHEGSRTLCLLAVDRTQQLRAEQAQRLAELAERERVASERRAFLAELTEALASTADPDTAMRRLARLVVPRLADWSVLTLREEDGNLRPVAWCHRDAAREHEVAALAFARAASLAARESDGGAAGSEATDATPYPAEASDADGLPIVDAPGPLHASGVMVLPLVGRGRTYGDLLLATTTERGRHTDDERALALDVALRAGPALDTARVAQRARNLAESMQRSLLAVSSPGEGIEVTTRYRPAFVDREVGGDWFDSFRLPGGTTFASIGDVMGHDLAAIAAMAQLRTLVRATAWTLRHSPAEVLTATDDANFGLGLCSFATAIAAEFGPAAPDGSVVLRWSNAGHMPPLLVTPEGSVALLGRDRVNVPLGVEASTPRDDQEVLLAPGSTLLLYTDGLIERRRRDIDEGFDILLDAVRSRARDPLDQLLDGLLDELAEEGLRDDVAMLAVRVGSGNPAESVIELPFDATAPTIGRRHLEVVLAGVAPDVRDDVLLLASEVITNAVHHGAAPVVLDTRLSADEIEVGVRDHGPGRPVLSTGVPDLDAPSGRGLFILASIADRWGTTAETGGAKRVWFVLARRR